MRTAAIYDIHGNLPALEAVISEIRRAKVDQIVVGGDVVPGPMPGETLERLLALDIPTHFILGNGEVAVLQQMAGQDPAGVPEQYRPVIRWNAEHLNEYRRVIEEWPKTLLLSATLFCHGTPRDENECFTRLTPEHLLRPVFDGLDASVVICGHTHMQFNRMIGDTRVVNAGSVGMPFGAPGADWLLLGPDVELRHTDYDLQRAAELVRATGYPDAEEFAARYILNPPTEQEMLRVFTDYSVRGTVQR